MNSIDIVIAGQDWHLEEPPGLPDNWHEAVRHMDNTFLLSQNSLGSDFIRDLNDRIPNQYKDCEVYTRHFGLTTELAARIGYTRLSTLARHLYMTDDWPYTVRSVSSYHFFLADIFSNIETIKYKFLQSSCDIPAKLNSEKLEAYTFSHPDQIAEFELQDFAKQTPDEIANSRFLYLADMVNSYDLSKYAMRYDDRRFPTMHMRFDPFMHALIARRDDLTLTRKQVNELYKMKPVEAAAILSEFKDIYTSVGINDISELTTRLDN